MTPETAPGRNAEEKPHRWRFFSAGGFDQVRLDRGSDIANLHNLDQKLWAALACPVDGLEFDRHTLQMIDTDGDGRIRAPELTAAAKWAATLLKDPETLLNGSPELALTDIDDSTPEGAKIKATALGILELLGRKDAGVISVADVEGIEQTFAQSPFNGDGIVPPKSSEDESLARLMEEIILVTGGKTDASGLAGVDRESAASFFTSADDYLAWWDEAHENPEEYLPLGEDTSSLAALVEKLAPKIDDYFTRIDLASFDPGKTDRMNRSEEHFSALSVNLLSRNAEGLAEFPLARIEGGRNLPLAGGLNPAWAAAVADFRAKVVFPLIGEREELSASEWAGILERLARHASWSAARKGEAAEQLGVERLREIKSGNFAEKIDDLIARDEAFATDAEAIENVSRLVRYNRDLVSLLNNFVNMRDFYTRRDKAVFQAGTLFIDGRSLELCVKVGDIAKHAALATLGKTYLVYCELKRNGATEKYSVAAAFTDGDSDRLMVGRNGIFYDRNGVDYDATIVRIMEHPIGLGQAFFAPYKRIGRMIGEQVEKLAASREKAVTDKARAQVETGAKVLDKGEAAQPFDVAKFAGIFAAIGLAVGAIGTAVATMVSGFLGLQWWKMPLALIGLLLVVSTPSVVMAWLKLRQRSLAPILDANGWAVNTKAKLNIEFGRALTSVAKLPKGSDRALKDPYAPKKHPVFFSTLFLLGVLAAWATWKFQLVTAFMEKFHR